MKSIPVTPEGADSIIAAAIRLGLPHIGNPQNLLAAMSAAANTLPPLSVSRLVGTTAEDKASPIGVGLDRFRRVMADLKERFGDNPRAYWRGSAELIQKLRVAARQPTGADDWRSPWNKFCSLPIVEKGSREDVAYEAQGWQPIEMV